MPRPVKGNLKQTCTGSFWSWTHTNVCSMHQASGWASMTKGWTVCCDMSNLNQPHTHTHTQRMRAHTHTHTLMTHAHACTHPHPHPHERMRTRAHTHTLMNACAHVHTCTHTHTRGQTHITACMRTHTHTHSHMHAQTHSHAHTTDLIAGLDLPVEGLLHCLHSAQLFFQCLDLMPAACLLFLCSSSRWQSMQEP